MRSFYISLRSEFYKSRKTLAFWAAIILPVVITSLVAFGFYSSSGTILKANFPGMILWAQFSGATLGVMGMLILPFYIIFMTFSVNNIEHKNDTWKALFSQPLDKLSIYAAKYVYTIILVLLTLVLFATLTFAFGHLLQIIVPKYTFNQYNPTTILSKYYIKLFLASLGILSFQFVLSILWADFLKPMGIGFIGVIVGIITANAGWKHAYLITYSNPSLVLRSSKAVSKNNPESFLIFTSEIWVSLTYAIVLFFIGYFILARKNVK